MERHLNPAQLWALSLMEYIWGACGQDLRLECQIAFPNICTLMAQAWAKLPEGFPCQRDRGLWELLLAWGQLGSCFTLPCKLGRLAAHHRSPSFLS